MLSPLETLRLIDQRHARFLGRHSQMVVAGLYLAWSPKEMATDLVVLSPRFFVCDARPWRRFSPAPRSSEHPMYCDCGESGTGSVARLGLMN